MKLQRQDHELPSAITQQGWRYHHIGIPTSTPHSNEQYLPQLKMYITGFKNSPYGVEWMRFDSDCQIPELIKTVPHVAFEVDDINAAIAGQTLLSEVNSPSEGVRVAMIIDDGAPIELIEFSKSK